MGPVRATGHTGKREFAEASAASQPLQADITPEALLHIYA
jgi:hypothetical protein